jgi:hypothetical protein
MRKLLVLLAAVAFVFTFTTPAAADVKFGGYVAFDTYMHDVDNPGAKPDDSDLDWTYDNVCSRFNVTFKEGPVGAFIEARPNSAGWLRHWWGTWNFGGGTLGIGQYWTPEFTGTSSMLYQCGAMDLLSGGGLARLPMIQLQFGNFKIALATPNTAAVLTPYSAAGHVIIDPADAKPGDEYVDGPYADGNELWYRPASGHKTEFDTSLPKIMVSYNLNMGGVGLKLYGGFQSYDEVETATDRGHGIDSMLYGLKATMGFGQLSLAVNVWGGNNLAEYGRGDDVHYAAYWDGTKICDESSMVYGFDLGYKVSDTVGVTAGYFTGTSELDRPGTWEWETSQYHVNATFTLAKGVSISPEYAVFDFGDKSDTGTTTAEQAKESRLGVYWKIAF